MLELILVTSIWGYLVVSFFRLCQIQKRKARQFEEIAAERELSLNEMEHLRMRKRFARIQLRIVIVLVMVYLVYLWLWWLR